MRRIVLVTLREPGFHRWSSAPVDRGFDHLRQRHRHLFTIRVEWLVSDADRQVEFHQAQAWVREAMAAFPCTELGYEFGDRSCETIATELAAMISSVRRAGPSAVEVWEDDECGGRVEWS